MERVEKFFDFFKFIFFNREGTDEDSKTALRLHSADTGHKFGFQNAKILSDGDVYVVAT